MRALWESLGPLPRGLRLYGGTAIALYLNHRYSTDFDFATPRAGSVDVISVLRLPYFGFSDARGGGGMVDAELPAPGRPEGSITLTFMEMGRLIPAPRRRPIRSTNGVAVAHPLDLIASKLTALTSRDTLRDYRDIAAAFRAWPDMAERAAEQLTVPAGVGRRAVDAGRLLSTIPPEVRSGLSSRDRRSLNSLARRLRRTGDGR